MPPRRRRTDDAIIPCLLDPAVTQRINALAERITADTLANRGALSEAEAIGMLQGAVERLRGQRAAGMGEKRRFIAAVLDHLRSRGAITRWEFRGAGERHDYEIRMGDRVIAVEAKGCLDGNNTNIFQRPPNADEFYIWSLCQNSGADPRHNVWSGIHTRLGAEIIARNTRVDGLIVWDMLCGTVARPCPKLAAIPGRETVIGQRAVPPARDGAGAVGEAGHGLPPMAGVAGEWTVPPPCIYLFPRTVPDPRNNTDPPTWLVGELRFADALHRIFSGIDDELTSVRLTASMQDAKVFRVTTLVRARREVAKSDPSEIKRANR